MRMREEAYREKAVPAKYKLLTAMSISIAIRCEPCIEAYVKMACDKGVSQEEFIEFLDVAMTMQGCPTRLFQKFREILLETSVEKVLVSFFFSGWQRH